MDPHDPKRRARRRNVAEVGYSADDAVRGTERAAVQCAQEISRTNPSLAADCYVRGPDTVIRWGGSVDALRRLEVA